jgi:hypothetical protein
MNRRVLTGLLPPMAVDLVRRLRPKPPMFSGVHATIEGVADERPWLSDARLVFAEQELAEAIAASRAAQPALAGSLLVPCLIVNLLSGAAWCSTTAAARASPTSTSGRT